MCLLIKPTALFFSAEALRKSPALIVRELMKLVRTRQLDTIAYADSVKQKKVRRATPKPAVGLAQQLQAERAAHRMSNRKHKRKISRMTKQIESLRKKCRGLQDENKRLRQTIQELTKGRHDILLKGESQEDMMGLMQKCIESPILDKNLSSQDDETGTLKAFWQEQVSRVEDANKRRRWNPIVLRFMLHLWEQMGEKHFRVLEDENVRVRVRVRVYIHTYTFTHPCQLFRLPSKRTLQRMQRKLSSLGTNDPDIYRDLGQLVSYIYNFNIFYSLLSTCIVIL